MNLTKRQKTGAGFITALVVVAAVVGFLNYPEARQISEASESTDMTPESSGVPEMRVPVMEIRKVDSWSRVVVHTGTVETRSQTLVAFQRGGLITELMVDEGRRVAEEQPLAKLDSRHLQGQQESLRARKEQAQAVLAELKKGPRPESIEAARNLVVDLQEQLNAQELRLARSEELLNSQSIARQDYEHELFAKRGVEARLNAAKSQLDELKAGTRIEQIDAQMASIKSIDADLKIVQYHQEDCVLEAPFSGMIISRLVDPGTVVSAGTPVFELIDDENLEVHVGIPQSFADQLKSGAIFKVMAGEQVLEGRMRVVLPRIDPVTRTCKAIFDVTLPANYRVTLFTGQLARVELTQEVSETGFWIPRKALTADHSGLWCCYVVERSSPNAMNGITRKHSVEILHQREQWAFVRGTIGDGQLLVSEGMHRIVPGQQISFSVTDPAGDQASFSTTSSNVTAEPQHPAR